MKIRLWGTEDECREAARRLARTPGLIMLSVSEPYADRGTSVLVRMFVEARLDPPPAAAEPGPASQTGRPPARRRGTSATTARNARANG